MSFIFNNSDKKLLLLALLTLCSLIVLSVLKHSATASNLEDIKKVNFHPKSLVNYFDISNDYYVEWHDANSATIHVEYPDMQPNITNHDFLMEKTIRIYIRGIDGGDEVKTFLQHIYSSPTNNCKAVVCYARKIETTSEYEIFREGTEDDFANKNGKANKYFLFEAYDEQKILVEDSGTWAKSFLIKRNINNFFIIQYQVPKKTLTHILSNGKVTKDVKIIDKTVTEFIKKQINFNKYENDNLK